MSDAMDPRPDAHDALASALTELRPRLHRYCSAMLRSAIDGEDVVQDTLAHALAHADALRDRSRLAGWALRIAHNRCIDVLRRRRHPQLAIDESEAPIHDDGADERLDLSPALAALVTRLPPRERACVLLKDVLDHSLVEIATIVGSNVGAVKAALHRGRAKLAAGADEAIPPGTPAVAAIVSAYAARFTARDWDGVRALLASDVRVEVVDAAVGHGSAFLEATYVRNFERLPVRWRLRPAIVDDEVVILQEREHGASWRPHGVIRLAITGDRIAEIRDYGHVRYLLAHATIREAP